MRVFVAGATGAIGRPLVRELRAAGHAVAGLTRSAGRRGQIEALGAEAFVADARDPEALLRVVIAARPTHVVHLLTALPPGGPLRPRDLSETNVLRTEGTRNLIAAARAAGARRLVAESFVGVYGPARYATPQEEGAAFVPAAGPLSAGLQAMRSLEAQLGAAPDLRPVALRIGLIYGPEVASTLELFRRLRRGRVVYPRGAQGVGSFVHVDDAARAIVAALQAEAPSPVYNVVDDEPMSIPDYLHLAARAVGARPPRPVPAFVVRWLLPLVALGAQTGLPLSNSRARRELGWQPRFKSLREGLPAAASALREPA